MSNSSSIFCPYPGLRPFTEEESLYFQGREQHIIKIKEELQKRQFLMVTGASGDGKSSLIFAGLIPSIKAGFFKASFGAWKISVFRPGNDPLTNFSKSLAPHFGADKETSIRSNLSLGYSSLADLYKNSPLFEKGNSGGDKRVKGTANLLIVVDQFEEFFTNKENFDRETATPSAEAHTAVNLLIETTRIAIEEGLPVYIVCTMRSDYIGNAPSFRGLPELIGKNQFFVPRLSRSEMLSAVTEPAVLAGAKISQRLAQRMLNDLSSVNTDVLPVLQHAVRRVWHAAADGSEELDVWHYCVVGGMASEELPEDQKVLFDKWFEQQPEEQKLFYEGQKDSFKQNLSNVLNLHGNTLFETVSQYYVAHGGEDISKGEAQDLVKLFFQCLTKIDDSRAVRNRITLREVTSIIDQKNCDAKKIGRIIDIYRDPENTLVYPFIEEGAGRKELMPETLLDITHEALIRNWRMLSQWTQEEHENAQVFKELRPQVERWVEEGRTRQHLLGAGPYEYYNTWEKLQNPNQSWIERYMDERIYKTDGVMISPLNDTEESLDATPKEDKTDEGRDSARNLSNNIGVFLDESGKQISRRQQIKGAVMVVISALLIAATVSLYLNKRLQKEITLSTTSNVIAAKAYSVIDSDPTLSFRLAEAAYNIWPTDMSRQVVMAAYAKEPFYNLLSGHKFRVNCVKFSKYNDYVLSASRGQIRLWNKNGQEMKFLNVPMGNNFNSNGINFHPDLELFGVSCTDSSAVLYDFTGRLKQKFIGHTSEIVSLVFSPDGKELLTASNDSTALVWSMDGRILHRLDDHNAPIRIAKFSADGSTIVTIGFDHKAVVWNRDGKKLSEFKEFNLAPWANTEISSDGSMVLLPSKNGEIIIWQTRTGNALRIQAHEDEVWSTRFSPDEKKIVSSSIDNSAKLWDLEGNLLATFQGHKGKLWDARFSPDGKYVLTVSDDALANIWDLEGNLYRSLAGHTSQIYSGIFSSDGHHVATCADDNSIRLWNIHPDEHPNLVDHYSLVDKCAFSPDGEYVITGGYDYTGKLWTSTGYLLKELTGHKHYGIYNVGFAPDGSGMITCSADGTARLWDKGSDEYVELELGTSVFSFEYSSNSKYILLSGNGQTVLYDRQGEKITLPDKISGVNFGSLGDSLLYLSSDGLLNLACIEQVNRVDTLRLLLEIPLIEGGLQYVWPSTRGTHLVTVSKGDILKLWQIIDGDYMNLKQVDILSKGVFTSNLGFSPNGKYVFFSQGRSALIYDIQSNAMLELLGHTDVINSIAFSPDHEYIVTASMDNTTRVWNLKGETLEVFTGHEGSVADAEFSPNGKYILSSSNDRTARIMPVFVDQVLAKINGEKVRGAVWKLTEEDKLLYGISD